MNAGWNLPDGCHPFDVPHNDAASDLFERQWAMYSAEIKQQARDDLMALCALPGRIRSDYLTYCADHGLISVIDYVSELERIDALEWQRTVHLWTLVQFDPEVA